jgi:hypothetical protein
MSKFVIVDKAPKNLKDNELVISEPTFVDEIKLSKNQPRPHPNGKYLTSLAHLRAITGTIGELYDPEGFNQYSSIPLNHFVGIEYGTVEELSSVVLRAFNKFYPQIVFKYLDKQIKSRPQGTELIYFVGTKQNTEVFFANGINQLDGTESAKVSKKVTSKDA